MARKGGKARAESMTKEERSESARKAVIARWEKAEKAIKRQGKENANAKALLDSPALNVFLGTLPLFGAIFWGLLQNNRALDGIGKRIDGIDKRLDHVETKLETISKGRSFDRRAPDARETRLERSQIVFARARTRRRMRKRRRATQPAASIGPPT